MLFSTTTHTKPTTTQQENHQNTTTHTTTTTIKKIKDQRKSKNSKSQKRRSVRGSIKITQKIKITQRDQFVGSWRKGSGLPAKSKACGLKALDRWSIRGFVNRFVDQRSQRHDLRWRHDLGSLSLSLCAWVQKWFEVKILTKTNFRVKAIKTHSQLKIFSEKFIFHAQPNTSIYRKVFPEVIWSQNKLSLSPQIVLT